MTYYDDPNREAVGEEPIWTGAGEEVPPEVPDGEAFDPSAHTVDEVNAYLESNPTDAERVLELERSGKARVGVLGE